MEISNHGKHLNVPAPHKLGVINSDVTTELKASEGVARSTEVQPQRLLTRLQGDAEVRNRLLVEIQSKVQSGEYFTRAAVERAAAQIVGL